MTHIDYLNLSLSQIQVFLHVCKFNSFTTASQALHMTQSSVSKSIAAMENVLGFQLFLRNNKRFQLTEAGRLLYQKWPEVLRTIELSVEEAHLLNQSGMSKLILGEPDAMESEKDYLPAIEQFQASHPGINLTFEDYPLADLAPSLIADEIDAYFTLGYEIPTIENLGLSWETVADGPFVSMIMHKSNPLARLESITMAHLREEEFIVLSPAQHLNYINFLQDLCRPYGFSPKINVCTVNARSMITTLLRSKKGIVMAGRFIYGADHPDLKQFPLANTYDRMVIVWKKSHDNPALEELVSLVTADYRRQKKQPAY